MGDLGWQGWAWLVFLLGVVPACGITFFGVLTALAWRAVVRSERRRRSLGG